MYAWIFCESEPGECAGLLAGLLGQRARGTNQQRHNQGSKLPFVSSSLSSIEECGPTAVDAMGCVRLRLQVGPAVSALCVMRTA